MLYTRLAAAIAALSIAVSAHPGHNVAEEALERRQFLQTAKRSSLAHCAEKLRKRGVERRNIQRRARQVDAARIKRKLRRDLDTLLDTSHNETGVVTDLDPSSIFSSNASCILTPEVTQGPYYVAGEYVRTDLTDDQEGVSLEIDYQVIDVDTCDPVPNVYLEMWHCNSTGVYSGIVASGNGDSSDESNINKTFLRGIQETDSDGVAGFTSIFPGHYTSRATHIHIMIHTGNVTELSNDTIGTTNIKASHVGQAFFDQDLITEVELTSPYSTNTQELTTNADDSILAEETATDGVDPFFDYVYLGDSVEDGLFAWLAFGINTSYSTTITPAATLYESGGVEN